MDTNLIPFPPTTTRVERNIAEEINQRIEQETVENVTRAVVAGPDAIARRLVALNHEWDIERLLEANAASVSLIGLSLGFCVDRRWFALPVVVAAFLLQHAVQGWCPPLPVLRRLGLRTSREIDIERTALRILRGDFQSYPTTVQDGIELAEQDPA